MRYLRSAARLRLMADLCRSWVGLGLFGLCFSAPRRKLGLSPNPKSPLNWQLFLLNNALIDVDADFFVGKLHVERVTGAYFAGLANEGAIGSAYERVAAR